MATPKKKATEVRTIQAHHKSDVRVHLFMGVTLGLLLFLSAAQFIMTRIIWEKVMEEKVVAQQPSSEAKETTYSFSVYDFNVQIPSSFNIREQKKDGYTVYEIADSTSWNSVRMYLKAYQEREVASVVNTGGDNVLRATEDVGPITENGDYYVVEYWSENSADPARVELLKNTVKAIEWNIRAMQEGGYTGDNP